MKRILTIDLVVWLGLPLVASLVALRIATTPQTWTRGGVVVLSAALLTVWAVGLSVLWGRWCRKPDYTLNCGAEVWTNGLPVVALEVESAIRVVIATLPSMLCRKDVTPEALIAMFAQAGIEFVKHPIPLGDNAAAGVQRGHYMRIQGLGGLRSNAFIHEVIHMVQETVANIPVDYDHEATEWWRHERHLRELAT